MVYKSAVIYYNFENNHQIKYLNNTMYYKFITLE